MVKEEEDFIRRNFLTIKTMNQKQIYKQVVSSHHTLTPGELGSTRPWHHPGGMRRPEPYTQGPWSLGERRRKAIRKQESNCWRSFTGTIRKKEPQRT